MHARTDIMTCLRNHRYVLAEGAVLERVRRARPELLDPLIENSGMIYSEEGRQVLAAIYREYISIGASYDLPMIVFAPTWRASQTRITQAGFSHRDVNGDCVQFLKDVRDEFGSYAADVYVAGLMACANDAYKPQEKLKRRDAMAYHASQAEALVKAGVDFIMPATLPAYEEAAGIALLLSKLDAPYVVSFVLDERARLLDGLPLWKAMDRIDTLVDRPPLFYMVNCVHHLNFATGVMGQAIKHSFVDYRVMGLQGNTSRLHPEKLDGMDQIVVDEDPDNWAEIFRYVSRVAPIKIAGGCCGTDGRYIAALARHLVAEMEEIELRNAKVW